MNFRVLGKSGIAVSELCLGTMTFGNTTNESDSIDMIHQFLDREGNFLDTANVYVGGKSEEIVGKAIRHRRSDVILATKMRFPTSSNVNHAGLSRKNIFDAIDASLRRLQTDYVDLYQMHVWDHITPVEETIRTLDDLITSGKVRYIGCSNFLAWQLMKSLSYSDYHRYARYISIQPQYSLINREMDREMLSLCQEENVAIIPWAPIGGGFLSGKYKRNTIPKEGRLSGDKGESSWANRNNDKNFAILDMIEQIANEMDKTPSQVALNWLLSKPGITSPIFGARTLEQFDENMGSLGWRLSENDWKRLDQISALADEYPNRFIEKFKRII